MDEYLRQLAHRSQVDPSLREQYYAALWRVEDFDVLSEIVLSSERLRLLDFLKQLLPGLVEHCKNEPELILPQIGWIAGVADASMAPIWPWYYWVCPICFGATDKYAEALVCCDNNRRVKKITDDPKWNQAAAIVLPIKLIQVRQTEPTILRNSLDEEIEDYNQDLTRGLLNKDEYFEIIKKFQHWKYWVDYYIGALSFIIINSR